MFDRFREDLKEPERFVRGPLAVRIAGSYLVLVVVAWLILVITLVVGGTGAADNVALPLVVLTAPLSLTCAAVIGNTFYPVPPVLGSIELLLYGLLIAWWLWRVVRGGRYVG